MTDKPAFHIVDSEQITKEEFDEYARKSAKRADAVIHNLLETPKKQKSKERTRNAKK